jgi:hypothetical protein
MMFRITQISLAVACILVLLAPQQAEAREWRITLEVASVSIQDPGYLNIADSGWLVGADIGAQVGVGSGFLVGLRTRFGGSSGGTNFTHDIQTDLEFVDLLATARWHTALKPWVRPFVEVEVGASRATLMFHTSSEGEERWGAAAGGQAGLEFRLPPGLWFDSDFSVGIEISGGYHWRQEFDFNDTDGVDLGSLDLHGALWRVGVSVMW